jgi:hypothetical protein
VLFEAQGKGLVLRHDGLLRLGFEYPEEVRWVGIYLSGRHGQYERHIYINFIEPRRRKKSPYCYVLSPDGCCWYTVERDGVVEFDSRGVFPVYSSVEEYQRLRDQRHGYGPGPENDAAVARYDAQLAELYAQRPDLKAQLA